MRKFVFTLEAVLRYKQTIEKTQKAALAEVNARIAAMTDEKRALEDKFERTKASQAEVLRSGVDIPRRLQWYALYFRELHLDITSIRHRIIIAEAEREQRIQELLVTTRELKSYNKLRDEQYAEYMKEVRAEEERDIGEFVARQAIQ